MTDIEKATEVAGKLLGRVQCYRCMKYVPIDETYMSDPRAIYIMPLCDKCMSNPGVVIVNGVGR